MNKTLYILIAVLALMVGCSEDEPMMEQTPRTTLRVPILWMPDTPDSDKAPLAIGDPGEKEELPYPANVYVFSWLKTNATTYEFFYTSREGLTEADWMLMYAGTSMECYRLESPIELRISKPVVDGYTAGDRLGRTYAIATNKKLTATQLQSIVGTDYVAVLSSADAIEFNATLGGKIDDRLQKAEFSTDAAVSADGTAWTSSDFRDLYSSPALHDGRTDNGIRNGEIIFDDVKYPAEKIAHGSVRLYHVAARIDFQWEVAASLWSTTAIKSITLNNLPTNCTVFKPAENAAIAADNPAQPYVIDKDNPDNPIDPGNKWIGRQYLYHLQPNGGAINYTVAFENDARPSKTLTFTPATLHPVFTGWYRIVATVE